MKRRRIDVEIDALVVEDPAHARRGEIAIALQRELARLAAEGEPLGRSGRRARARSVALGDGRSEQAVGRAIARSVGEEFWR